MFAKYIKDVFAGQMNSTPISYRIIFYDVSPRCQYETNSNHMDQLKVMRSFLWKWHVFRFPLLFIFVLFGLWLLALDFLLTVLMQA
jgi:hypothetical protein